MAILGPLQQKRPMKCTTGRFFNLISMIYACVHNMEQDCSVATQRKQIYANYDQCQKCSLLIFLFHHVIRMMFQNDIMQEIGVPSIFYAVNEQLANIIWTTNTAPYNSSYFIPAMIYLIFLIENPLITFPEYRQNIFGMNGMMLFKLAL